MACMRCGSGPSTHVEMSHNIGMLIVRQSETTSAHLCRGCVTAVYWYHQIRNLTLGWWGVISFFLTCVYLVGNTIAWISALSQLQSRHSETRRRLNPTSAPNPEIRLDPFRNTIRIRLEDADAQDDIARDIAQVAEVSVRQASSYVKQIAADR